MDTYINALFILGVLQSFVSYFILSVSFEFYTGIKEMINSFDLNSKICVVY